MAYLMTVTMPYFTGLAADVMVNTWHFNWVGVGTPDSDDFEALAIGLENEYSELYSDPGTGPAAPWIEWDQARFTVYDLTDPPPRVPVYDDIHAIGAQIDSDGTSFPMEAACVLSYRADYLPGINRQRQRGRIYLGGFSSERVDQGTTTTFPRWDATQMAVVGAMGVNVVDLSSAGWQWVVYSRAGGGITFPVVAGWVDAEIDTQRRRGNVLEGTRIPWTS